MKKALLKRITAAVCAAATVAALSITASAKDFVSTSVSYFEGHATSTENSYIGMSMQAGETPGLAVLKSHYERTRDRYSLTTHYACPLNSAQYRLAYAYVYGNDGAVISKDYAYSDQEESIVAYVTLYNKPFNNKTSFTRSVGCCSLNKYLPLPEHAYNFMEARLIFDDV